MIQLGEHFSSDDRSRHSEWLRRRQWFIKAKQEHHRKEDIADKLDDEILSFAAETVIATQVQIKEFQARIDAYETRLDDYNAKLDIYDAAITHALMEHLQRLEILEAYHAELLANAFVLEDGTRVFKSEDGTFVIDEKGQMIGPEMIDPKTIPDGYTTAQELTASLTTIDEENAVIDKLHKAHDDVVDARAGSRLAREKLGAIGEAINKEGLTVDELEGLGVEIDALMPTELPTIPNSAARYLSGIDTTDNAPNAKTAFSANANPASIIPAVAPEQALEFDPMR